MSAPPLPFVARWLELERAILPAPASMDTGPRADLQLVDLLLSGGEQWAWVRVNGAKQATWLRGPQPRTAEASRAWWRTQAEKCFELHRTPARRRA